MLQILYYVTFYPAMISENSTQNLNAVDFDKNRLVHKMNLMECV